MAYALSTVKTLSRFQRNYHDAALEEGVPPREFDPMIISMLFQVLGPILANCMQKPPAPPALAPDLAAQGVTVADWKDAHDANWLATNAYKESRGKFNAKSIKNYADEYAKENPSATKKECKVQAKAALMTAKDSTVEELAVSRSNARAAA